MNLAIVTTHPIQYNAPWFKMLASQPGINLKVFYTWEQANNNHKYDPGFGKVVSWDIPLLEGYDYTFVRNISDNPGSHHYKGIVNPTLNKEIQDWGADAILVFGWPFKSHLACMKYFKGKVPVLFRGDSTLLDEQPGVKQFMRRLFLRYVYSYVDYALYVGSNNKRYFLAHGLKEKQLIYIPHAIDNSRFNCNVEEYRTKASALKEKLGIGVDEFVVLFAGKFNTKKNPFFMLRLAEKLQDKSFRFLLVGNGELEERLKKEAVDDRVVFLDFQNQTTMPVVYYMANVFVLPSVGPGETWGLAINEALACNKQVIATTKVGGAVDLIKNNENGLVVEPNDIEGAAKYIEQLLMQQNGSNKSDNREVLELHSFDNVVAQLTALLQNIKIAST